MEAETELGHTPRVVLVDFHAEATSEKQGLGWYLDGRVSAVVGTHTPRWNCRCPVVARWHGLRQRPRHDRPPGLRDRHRDPPRFLERFRTGLPQRFKPADGPCVLNSVLIDIDSETGHATEIVRIDRTVN